MPGLLWLKDNDTDATKVDVNVTCGGCGEWKVVTVSRTDYTNWKFEGVFAQVAFPYLTADERELLMSQTCGECWDKLWGDDDDEG